MRKIIRNKNPLFAITNWRDRRHPEAGGAEAFCEELAERCGAKGYDVVVLCARVKGAPSMEQQNGYRIIRMGGRFTVYPLVLGWLAVHRREVSMVMDSENGIPFFTPLVLKRSTPVVLLLHHIHQDQFAKYFSPGVALIGRWIERVGCRWVYGQRAVAAMSNSTASGARSIMRLSGPITVIHTGWTTVLKIDNSRLERTINPTLVAVGRLVPHKRHEMLIAALASLIKYDEKVHLHLIGSGPEEHTLKSLAKQLSVTENITFHHGISDLERDELLSSAWMTVNASQGEGWGLSIIEANSLGIPALAFNRPGLKDSIQAGETGWLLEDDVDLAQGIRLAIEELRDLAFADEISERAREWASQFSWERMVADVLEVFEAERVRLQIQRQK